MKRLATIIGLLFCFLGLYSFKNNSPHHVKYKIRPFVKNNYHLRSSVDTIPKVPRSNATLYAVDARLAPQLNDNIPIYTDTLYADTAHVNNIITKDLQIGNDYVGAMIYTSSDNNLWVRKVNGNSKYWALIGNGGQSVILPSCGLGNNGITTTGFLTYDSSFSGGAVFDVKGGPYALCCDHQARTLNDTVILIPSPIDPDNPAFVGVYLGAHGVSIVIGTPNANPEVPQSPDICALLLTYILFNAGETIPANVTQNIIYDENYNTEWQLDTAANATIDTADVSFPAHLLKDMKFTSFLNNGSYFEFSTANTINLNDYGALKFYVRKTGLAPIKLLLTWFLDDVPQTLSIVVNPQGATAPPTYETIVIPLSSFRFISNSQVNKLRVEFTGVSSPTFIIDWIQLQGGIPNPQTIVNGITQVSAVGDTILNPIVNTPNSTPQLILALKNQAANTIFLTHSNVPSQPAFDKMDLSRDYFTGLLPPIDIGGGLPGQFLGWTSGAGWQDFENDTTFVLNWLRRNPVGSNNNDSLVFGARDPDSALLSFETYVGLNSFPFHIEQNGNDRLLIDPVINRTDLQATDGVAISGLGMDASIANSNVQFSIGADDGSGHSASINADALQGTLIFTSTKFTKFSSGVVYQIANESATYAILPTDYTINCISGTFTVTLLTAVGIEGQMYIVKNSGAGTITLACTGGQTIDGAATKSIATTRSLMVQSDGANWIIVAQF